MNDSILILNNQNRFADLSGSHALKFSSGTVELAGKIKFEKTGRDLYTVLGTAVRDKNNINVSGEIKRVSEKHLNFTGVISQKINGVSYRRTKKTTFFDEGQGEFWRLQNKINGEGFADYIDIYF